MALRLNDVVIGGELIATQNYSVHGFLKLRDEERPLVLQLTGNPSPDLIGKHLRFEVRSSDETDPDRSDETETDLSSLAWQQIGPTGTITADHKVKITDCSPEELYMRCKLGEPPPFEWKQCLYLEWFSQNGRVVVEIVDPILEFINADGSNEDSLHDSTRVDDITGWEDKTDVEDDSDQGLDITSIRLDEDGNAEIRKETFNDWEEEQADENSDDPYGLFPKDLLQQFDAESHDVDRMIESDEDKSDSIRELELMDDLIENGEGVIIASIFDSPLKLPRPEQLTDEQAESALKSLLTELAMFGIALDVCKHYTPRDAYRLLVEEICTEERAYPELQKTQWVQQFMTAEFCEKCDEEMEREFEEFERWQKENGGDGPSGTEIGSDDDLPF